MKFIYSAVKHCQNFLIIMQIEIYIFLTEWTNVVQTFNFTDKPVTKKFDLLKSL